MGRSLHPYSLHFEYFACQYKTDQAENYYYYHNAYN